MNFFKSGWSYLSSSFTQSEGDPNEDGLNTSQSEEILEDGVDVANEQWEDTVESNRDMIDFADAFEDTEGQISDRDVEANISNSQEPVINHSLEQSTELEQDDNKGANLLDLSVEAISVMDDLLSEDVSSVEVVDSTEAVEKVEAVKGYTSLEASDSDDSGEFIPPPAAPIGKSGDTESQLNEIIKNLGGDLGILTLEDEDNLNLPGDKTLGESLYVTAIDHTLCPGNETVDSFSVTAVEGDLNCSTSPDSAIASSSKSSICSGESLKLNFDSDLADVERPSTPTLLSDKTLNDTPCDSPFSDSVLNTTVKEAEIISQDDNKVQETKPELQTFSVEDKPSETTNTFENASDIPIETAEQNNQSKPYPTTTASKSVTKTEQQNPNSATKMDDASDEIPISRGAYSIDFDNLDDLNPFQSKKAMCNSPEVPSKPFPASITNEQNNSTEETAINSNHKDELTSVPNSVVQSEEQLSTIINAESDILPNQNATPITADTSSVETIEVKNESANIKSNLPSKIEQTDLIQEQTTEEVGIPISKGSYSLDLDNLDNMDPFKTSKGIQNSPTKPKAGGYNINLDNLVDVDPFVSEKTLSFSPPKSPVKNNVGLLKHMNNNEGMNVLPEPEKKKTLMEDRGGGDADALIIPTSDLIINDVAGNLENVDPAPQKKIAKKPVLGENRKKTTRPAKKKPLPVQAADSPANEEDAIIVPKGSYSINFDDLENLDPFKTSKGLSNSPTKTPSEQPSFNAVIANEQMPVALEDSPGKGTPVDPPGLLIAKQESIEKEQVRNKVPDDNVEVKPAEDKPKKKTGVKKKKPSPFKPPEPDDDEIPISKGTYNFDFDNLDAMDPFKTSKGLSNSPTDKKTMDFENMDPFKASKAMQNSPPASPVKVNETETKVAAVEAVKEPEKTEPKKKSTPPKKKKPAAFKPPPDAENNEDEIPIPKGAYNLDLDNLEAMDPFKTSKGLSNSPTDKKEMNFDNVDSFKSSNDMQNFPPLKVEDSETLGKIEEPKQPTPKKKITPPKKKKPAAFKPPPPENNEEDEIPIPKGTYNFDFDNLEAMDPFKTSKGLSNSPTDKKEMNFDNVDPFKSSNAVANSPPGSPRKLPEEKLEAEKLEEPEKPVEVKKKAVVKKKTTPPKKKKPAAFKPPVENNEEDEIPIPKGAYNLDFDNLEAMDPFKTAKGLSNSPTDEKTIDFDSVDPFKSSNAMANSPPASPTKLATKTEDLTESVVDETPLEIKEQLNEKPTEKEQSSDASPKEPKKPPKKKIGGLARKKLVKPGLKKVEVEDEANNDLPVSKGAYNLDFDNLDALDPFKSSKGLSNSPTKDVPPTVSGYSVNLDDLDSIDPFKSSKSLLMDSPAKVNAEPVSSSEVAQGSSVSLTPREIVTSVGEGPAYQTADETAYLSTITSPTENMIVSAQAGDPTAQNISDYQKLQKMEFDKMNEDEEFFPANSVFEDSAALAYLDKLGDVKPLTESQLKKQSLYVKFDPLVSDSPARLISEQISQDNRAKGDASNVILDVKSSGDNIDLTQQLITVDTQEVTTEQQQITAKTTNDLMPESVSLASTDVSFKPAMDNFDQPYLSQQSYQSTPTTLKYTQADFENAIRTAEQEWEKERNEHQIKEDTYKAEIEQMNNVVKEYERLFAEFSGNETQGGGMTRDQKLLKAEHEQSLEDLAALERSHEDLCRRYNRLKSMVAQFKQNEDILKKSTNEVLEEAKTAEKKYISLKIEADDKIKKANAELQFVKVNAQQEVARAQAQLKMLELKCESLNSQIRDCNKENEELTKLCDDLIACSKPEE